MLNSWLICFEIIQIVRTRHVERLFFTLIDSFNLFFSPSRNREAYIISFHHKLYKKNIRKDP